jgi:hypothetical protein
MLSFTMWGNSDDETVDIRDNGNTIGAAQASGVAVTAYLPHPRVHVHDTTGILQQFSSGTSARL